MFPNEKHELSAGCTEDRGRAGGLPCTKRQSGGLQKRAGRATEKACNCLYLQRRDTFRKQLFVPPQRKELI